MGKKKKIAKMMDAVKGILGNDRAQKKIKKAEALQRFTEKMEERRMEIKSQLETGEVKGKKVKELEKQLDILEKQIKKAGKILSEMAP